jgi:hypothetical protein
VLVAVVVLSLCNFDIISTPINLTLLTCALYRTCSLAYLRDKNNLMKAVFNMELEIKI